MSEYGTDLSAVDYLMFLVSVSSVFFVFFLYGSYNSRAKIATASDFAVAGRTAGPVAVAGVLSGALIAGGSTIGTVQTAYEVGLYAWWFTLGSGFGCAMLGLKFAVPLRRGGFATLTELMEHHYGRFAARVSLLGMMLGTLISVSAQFVAGGALLRSILPLPDAVVIPLMALLILAFIGLGGLRGFGAIGLLKTLGLVLLLVLCAQKVNGMGQSPAFIASSLPFSPWFNPFSGSLSKGLGACISLTTGVLCTQIYVQAVISARSDEAARRGCLIASCTTPPIGLLGIWIGLGLRNAGILYKGAEALPLFIIESFHPVLAGVLWGVLAITVIGGASGLCLGVATNLALDVILPLTGIDKNSRRALSASRLAVLLAVSAAALLGCVMRNSQILNISYLAMGLRGSGMLLPLAVALFRPGYLSKGQGAAATLAGLVAAVLSWLFGWGEPLFMGLSGSAILLVSSKASSWGAYGK